jgi:hypothetical protein
MTKCYISADPHMIIICPNQFGQLASTMTKKKINSAAATFIKAHGIT